MSSLKRRSLHGIAWTFAEHFSIKGVSFIVSIVLARILLPEEFGLIGMIVFVIAIGDTLRDAGMTQSLIRTLNPTEADYSTVFFVNLIASVAIYCLIFFSAPFIASFFERQVLTNIIQVLALKIPIGAISSIQNTRLIKSMQFKRQLIIELPSIIISGIIGIILAYKGFGVWSLVYMNLMQTAISSIQLWLYSSWYPKLIISKVEFKEHFLFGYKLTLSGLLDALYNNMYNVIIGKYYTAAQLGFYTRAQNTKQLPVSTIASALNKVTYPMFAEIQEDDKHMKSVYKRVMQQVLFWIAPALIGTAVIAEPLFRLLFTEKWLPAVPMFQLLCIVGILYPLHAYNLNILKVKGRSDLFLKVEVIKKIFTVSGVLLTFQFGIFALLGFQVFSNFVIFFINAHYGGKLINYNVWQQIEHISPIFVLSLIMGVICWLFNNFMLDGILNDIATILIISSLGLIIYFGSSHLFKLEPYEEFRKMLIKI